MKQLNLFETDLRTDSMKPTEPVTADTLKKAVRFMENKQILVSQRQRWEYLKANGYHEDAQAIALEYWIPEFRL